MTDKKSLSPAILAHIAQTLSIPLRGITAVIELLDDGGTVPFIARYRKEATGNLDEVQILAISERLNYFRDLEDRRATVLASIAEQGKLTPELKARIEAVLEKTELEDLYLPYKPKRRTKATIAREKGLEPLAAYLWAQQPAAESLHDLAPKFVSEENGVPTLDDALEGARHIVAEWISEDANLRKTLRQFVLDEGVIVSRQVTDADDRQRAVDRHQQERADRGQEGARGDGDEQPCAGRKAAAPKPAGGSIPGGPRASTRGAEELPGGGLAVVNAGFWLPAAGGKPHGVAATDRVLFAGPKTQWGRPGHRGTLGIRADGSAIISRLAGGLTLRRLDGTGVAIDDLNYIPLAVGAEGGDGELLLYTPPWGTAVPAPKGSTVVTLSKLSLTVLGTTAAPGAAPRAAAPDAR